jgi:hypothetical protein
MSGSNKFQLGLRRRVRTPYSFLKANLRLPPEGLESTYIKELLRCAILAGSVEDEFAFKFENAGYQLRQLTNGQIFTGTYIDQRGFLLRDQ